MGNSRFFGLVAGLFFVAFFGVKSFFAVQQPQPLRPDPHAPTFHRVDVDSPKAKFEASSASDNDPTRDRLRNNLMDYAKALRDDPCNPILKAHYISATNNYIQAWLSIAPCLKTHTCTNATWSTVERGAEAFGTPLDHRLREVMREVHSKHIFKVGDFPADTADFLAGMVDDGRITPRLDGPIFGKRPPSRPVRFDDDEPSVCG